MLDDFEDNQKEKEEVKEELSKKFATLSQFFR